MKNSITNIEDNILEYSVFPLDNRYLHYINKGGTGPNKETKPEKAPILPKQSPSEK